MDRKLKPTKKVAAGAIAGAVATLIISVLTRNGVNVTAEEAAAGTMLLSAVVSYMKKEL